jgi:hypothetical protein
MLKFSHPNTQWVNVQYLHILLSYTILHMKTSTIISYYSMCCFLVPSCLSSFFLQPMPCSTPSFLKVTVPHYNFSQNMFTMKPATIPLLVRKVYSTYCGSTRQVRSLKSGTLGPNEADNRLFLNHDLSIRYDIKTPK